MPWYKWKDRHRATGPEMLTNITYSNRHIYSPKLRMRKAEQSGGKKNANSTQKRPQHHTWQPPSDSLSWHFLNVKKRKINVKDSPFSSFKTVSTQTLCCLLTYRVRSGTFCWQPEASCWVPAPCPDERRTPRCSPPGCQSLRTYQRTPWQAFRAFGAPLPRPQKPRVAQSHHGKVLWRAKHWYLICDPATRSAWWSGIISNSL